MTPTIHPGLEDIVAASTRLSSVDGLAGELIIAGFALEELAGNATAEETLFLLWHDRLPDAAELADFCGRLAAQRTLPSVTLDLLRATAAAKAPVMDALRTTAGTLSLWLPPSDDPWAEAIALTARFPVIVAAYWRLLHGEEPIAPDPVMGHAANYLYMLSGNQPTKAQVRGLETYLNTVSDHGFNISTFAARVIIASGTDLTSAIVGAVGALKGPLHGGAPGPALETVFEIGRVERAEEVLRAKIERGERLMGFGHRVYKVRDPRADVLSAAAERLIEAGGDRTVYDLARSVEETALRLLEEYKPGRNLKTNVEFYTALLLHLVGMETELFTPTFAIGRIGGWIAHCFEQREAKRIIRPQSIYHGPRGRQWQR
ncbi:citrate synthase [bacterium]|nr:citrate synthase [bacterium]